MLISLFQIELIAALGTKTSSTGIVLPSTGHSIQRPLPLPCPHEPSTPSPPLNAHSSHTLLLQGPATSKLRFKRASPGQQGTQLRAVAPMPERSGLRLEPTACRVSTLFSVSTAFVSSPVRGPWGLVVKINVGDAREVLNRHTLVCTAVSCKTQGAELH